MQPAQEAETAGDARRDSRRFTALADLRPGAVTATALATLLDDGLESLHPEALLDLLTAADRLVAWAESTSLAVLGELQRRGEQPDPSSSPIPQPHPQAPDPTQELAAEVACLLALSPAAAQAKVVLAGWLRRLPAVAEALALGLIDLAKARALCEETAHLDRDAATEATDRVLPRAGGMPLGRVRARARAAAKAVDPEASRERRARNQRTLRDVSLQPGRDGLGCVTATLTETEAAELYGRVQQYARALVTADRSAGLPARRMGQARADAFLWLTGSTPASSPDGTDTSATAASEDAASPPPSPVPFADHPGARIGITVPLAALLGGLDRPSLGEIDGIGVVSAEEAAEACFRALRALSGGKVGIHFIVTDHTGRAVAVTGTTYTPPPLIRAAVEARDRTCRFPGCTRPAARCDLDHVTPYPAGATSRLNLAALCRHHHRLKTHSGWQVAQDPDGVLTWTSPRGRTYRTEPAIWTEPYDLPDQITLPPDLDAWPHDDAWLEDLGRRAAEVLGPEEYLVPTG